MLSTDLAKVAPDTGLTAQVAISLGIGIDASLNRQSVLTITVQSFD